jgi:hypothetical protein
MPDFPVQNPNNFPVRIFREQSQNSYAWTTDVRDGESPVSVVTFKAPDQTTLDETAEDLNILSLIFAQNLERALGVEGGETGDYKLGIPMLLQTGGRRVEANYLEGFGAVFNLKVRFPLVSAAVPEKDTQTSQMDSEWEQARRALTGAAQSDPTRLTPYDKTSSYSPKLVETLKRRVVELLKNASNLRHVQPDEWVAVTFAGPPNAPTQPSGVFRRQGQPGLPARNQMGKNGEESVKPPDDPQPATTAPEGVAPPRTTYQPASDANSDPKPGPLAGTQTPDRAKAMAGSGTMTGGGMGSGSGSITARQTPDRATIMTIRIKKKDADAFAADKMSEDQFFHAAEITSYLGPVIVNRAASDYRNK